VNSRFGGWAQMHCPQWGTPPSLTGSSRDDPAVWDRLPQGARASTAPCWGRGETSVSARSRRPESGKCEPRFRRRPPSSTSVSEAHCTSVALMCRRLRRHMRRRVWHRGRQSRRAAQTYFFLRAFRFFFAVFFAAFFARFAILPS